MRLKLPPKARRSSTATSRRSNSDTAPGGPVAPSAEYVRRGGWRAPAHARQRNTIFPRTRRSSHLVRRIVLFALLAASLALITVSYRGGPVITSLRVGVLNGVAPIEHGLTRAWQPIQGAYDWTGELVGATSANRDLRRQVDNLKTQLVTSKVREADNVKLREMLAIKQRGRFPDGYDEKVGRVIYRSMTNATNSVVIDLGSSDGLQVNDPVMMARGLIGRVELVGRNSATVGLLTSPKQAVTAAVVGSNANGMLRTVSGEGSPVFELAYVNQSDVVAVGDEVTTSGWYSDRLESIYPEGIPLGRVSNVSNNPADLYKSVQVTPFADFDHIDYVLVLVPKPGVLSRQTLDQPRSFGPGVSVASRPDVATHLGRRTQPDPLAGARRP